MLFDTHCHLNSEDIYPRIEEVKEAAEKTGVKKFLVVGYNKETSLLAVKIANKYENCYAAIGFHPTEIFDVTDDEYKEIMNLAKIEKKVVAIGEIGLDYHWINEPEKREIQKQWFIKQIEYANEVGLPVCIHNRESTSDCVEILKEHIPQFGTIMHCFSASVEIMEEVLKLPKSFISLGGPVTFTNAKTPKEVAEEVPLDRLLIETDSPYLTPHPFRGQKNEPKYLCLISEEIARLKNMSKKHLEDVIYKNSCRAFSINE